MLSFIPPDGKFKLLEYEAQGTRPIQIPINLKASVKVEEHGGALVVAKGD